MNRKIGEAVLEILKNDEKARKNDFILIAKVYSKLGLKPNQLTLNDLGFLSSLEDEKNIYPSFESITRMRRKMQELFPELRDKPTVEERDKESLRVLETLHDEELAFFNKLEKNTK